jgi:alkyldihydroxyacetonephosphate synthase
MAIDRTALRWNGWGWKDHPDAVSGRPEVWNWIASELGMPSLLATPARPLEEIELRASRLSAQDRRALNLLFGERMREDKHERAFHARGRSYHDLLRLRAGDLSDAPDAVIYAQSNQDVLKLLAFAAERSIAVVPYGGGTSVVGGVTPRPGNHGAAVSLDLSGMDLVESIDAESLTASAQAGISGPALEEALAIRGLTLGHFPQSYEFSTLGGWIAHRSAGQISNRYGKAEDWLAGLELATPRGMLREADFPASAAGPRLTDLVLGSEGVFGVVTRATVRVRPLPKAAVARAWLFRDFADGATAIREAVQGRIPAAMLRLSDVDESRFHRAFSSLGTQPGLSDRVLKMLLNARHYDQPCLLIAEFEGSSASVSDAKRAFGHIARAHGAMPLGARPAERWQQTRFYGPYLRDPMLDRGLGIDTLETATSWSKLQTLYAAAKSALQEAIAATVPRPLARGVVMCHISHSYPDGASLYFTYIFPRALGSEFAQWQAIKGAASEAILANGGTISHHHGVGEDHLPWIAREKGALGIEVLRAVKRTLDPKGILNPGKLIP